MSKALGASVANHDTLGARCDKQHEEGHDHDDREYADTLVGSHLVRVSLIFRKHVVEARADTTDS